MKWIWKLGPCALLLGALILLGACKESYEAGLEPGPRGEPGRSLDRMYLRDFRVSEAKYFAVLNEFYVFALAQGGDLQAGECFNDVLRLSLRKKFPCIVIYSTLGAPTKVHMTLTVTDRVHVAPSQDIFNCQVGIYVKSNYEPALKVAPAFVTDVEPILMNFDRDVALSAPRGP